MLPQTLIDQYAMNNEEIAFFEELIKQGAALPGEFQLDRLNSNAFSVYYEGIYLGKINLWSEPDSYIVTKRGARDIVQTFDDKRSARQYAAAQGPDYKVRRLPAPTTYCMEYLVAMNEVKEVRKPTLENCIKHINKWLRFIHLTEGWQAI